MPSQRAAALIALHLLAPHPEGGYVARTHTGSASAPGGRPLVTSILYLLEAGQRSALHSLAASDELWFHHEGDALEVVELSVADAAGADARVSAARLGPGGALSHTVPARAVFGARVPRGGPAGFALVSCAVAPGFDYAEWRLEGAADLRARFAGAAAAAAIEELASAP